MFVSFTTRYLRRTCDKDISILLYAALRSDSDKYSHLYDALARPADSPVRSSTATLYPSDPIVLDDWETENVYDQELATAVGCTPGREDADELIQVNSSRSLQFYFLVALSAGAAR
jgi:hypothetical protein